MNSRHSVEDPNNSEDSGGEKAIARSISGRNPGVAWAHRMPKADYSSKVPLDVL